MLCPATWPRSAATLFPSMYPAYRPKEPMVTISVTLSKSVAARNTPWRRSRGHELGSVRSRSSFRHVCGLLDRKPRSRTSQHLPPYGRICPQAWHKRLHFSEASLKLNGLPIEYLTESYWRLKKGTVTFEALRTGDYR